MSKRRPDEHGLPGGGPQRIGDLLGRLMARKGYAERQVAEEMETWWKQAAGAAWGAQSRPGKLSRGVLHVVVRNSAVLQELTFQKRALLASMGELSQGKVRDLRLRVGEID
jgi:hypothetical protein